jgi:integrase
MSTRTPKPPSYRYHKARDCAIVTICGKDHYLGPYRSQESYDRYDKLIAEWKANGYRLPQAGVVAAAEDKGPSINDLLLAFGQHIEEYYRRPDGSPTSEVREYKRTMSVVRRLYGPTPAKDFGPLALRAVREDMIASGICRGVVNQRVNRVRRLFKWAAGRELVDGRVYQNLKTVEGLHRGRSAARETDPVPPVAEEVVAATLPFLCRHIAAMVKLQLLTAARPGEIAGMRGVDLDRSRPVWRYRPGSDQGPHGQHKTAWRGKDKVIFIGPQAQAVLTPFLKEDPQAYLFSPKDSRDEFDALRRFRRKTPLTPSQAKRAKKPNPKRRPKQRYSVTSYYHGVERGVELANRERLCGACKAAKAKEPCGSCAANQLPYWHPNQLRHRKATEIREKHGVEAAQVVLGHAKVDTTQVYAERDLTLAEKVIGEIG